MSTYTMPARPGWAVGDTISVYALDLANRPTGSAVTTATVASDRTTTFTGLTTGVRYQATNGTTIVNFTTLTDPNTGGGQVGLRGGSGLVTAPDFPASNATFVSPLTGDYQVFIAQGSITLVNIGPDANTMGTVLLGAGGNFILPEGWMVLAIYTGTPVWEWIQVAA